MSGAKGKNKGKGKGKGKPSTGKRFEHKSYYFDVFPEPARGRLVVKCKTPNCYGCALYGDNPPKRCTKCHKDFDYNRFRDQSEEQVRGSSNGSNVNSDKDKDKDEGGGKGKDKS